MLNINDIDNFLDLLEKIIGPILIREEIKEQMILEINKQSQKSKKKDFDEEFYSKYGGLTVNPLEIKERQYIATTAIYDRELKTIYGYTISKPSYTMDLQLTVLCLFLKTPEGKIKKKYEMGLDHVSQVRLMTLGEIKEFNQQILDELC